MDRGRIRVGRRIMYYPTAAEQTTYGVGPFAGAITAVEGTGATVAINVDFPPPLAGYGTIDAAYGAPERDALIDATIARQKTGISLGASPGQASLFATGNAG